MYTGVGEEGSSVGAVFDAVLKTLSRLARRIVSEAGTCEILADLMISLESLPLTSEEFVLARSRMQNACRYLRSDERGAARWELNALFRQLDLHAKTQNQLPSWDRRSHVLARHSVQRV